ncbi:MAG: ImmA/IrrE family metallo-endopeptidase [Candidatus Cybelea sp.]|jgi:Zn-dependent peptidase ImmA (M78 family)
MSDKAIALCTQYGVHVRFADLGDWGKAELRAEYDPRVPEICINRRLSADLVEFAVLHELYHHREAIGEIAVLRDRAAREDAADAYAAQLLEVLA